VIPNANINKEDSNGTTPLFKACFKGYINIVKYLVESGARINKENNNSATPIFNPC